jgi:hypothetical protein
MFRIKPTVLSSLAVFALSATVASTASAVTHEFKVGGTTIAKGSKVEVQYQSQESSQLEGELAKTSITIGCSNMVGPASSSNVLEAEGKAKLKTEFKACTLGIVSGGKPENVPGCKIGNGGTIIAEANGELAQTEEGVIKYTGSQGATEKVSTFEITEAAGGSPKCPLGALTVEVKGKQLCSFPKYGFEAAGSEVLCTAVGSESLQLGKAGGSESKNARFYVKTQVGSTNGKQLGLT